MFPKWLNYSILALAALAVLVTVLQQDYRPKTPAKLFPDAIEVRAFAWGYGPQGQGVVQLYPEGVTLTPKDVVKLRRAIFWTIPPEAVAACCIPRHSFEFFDAQKRKIGTLEVCFECLCARIDGEAAPSGDHSWLDWNYGAVEEVLASHGIPIEFETDAGSGAERPKQ